MKSYKSLNILQAYCQSPTSQRPDQSFFKELAKPTQEKMFLKISQPLKKNKKTPRTTRHRQSKKQTENDTQIQH
jgi:DNA-binding FadR family transcriptional regulator